MRIVETLSRALSRSDLVIISGGLGPTEDDLTRGAVAAVANRPLELDEEALEAIEAYFRRRYGEGQMPPNNRKQAYLPRGASAIPNHWGTAQVSSWNCPVKPLLPAWVPAEANMFAQTVTSLLPPTVPGNVLVTKNLSFAGIGESWFRRAVEGHYPFPDQIP